MIQKTAGNTLENDWTNIPEQFWLAEKK